MAVAEILETIDTIQTDAPATARTVWEFDPAHTLIEFSGKHMVFTTVKGRFAGFRGTITTDTERPEASSVQVEIDAASLGTGTQMRDDHLRSADFLDAANYPTITFTSRRVELPAGAAVEPGLTFRVVGDLTIRGTTRPVVLDAVWHGQSVNPYGLPVTGFSASTRINRKDFGLTWNMALETGGMLVGDQIKIELEAQAQPRAEA